MHDLDPRQSAYWADCLTVPGKHAGQYVTIRSDRYPHSGPWTVEIWRRWRTHVDYYQGVQTEIPCMKHTIRWAKGKLEPMWPVYCEFAAAAYTEVWQLQGGVSIGVSIETGVARDWLDIERDMRETSRRAHREARVTPDA